MVILNPHRGLLFCEICALQREKTLFTNPSIPKVIRPRWIRKSNYFPPEVQIFKILGPEKLPTSLHNNVPKFRTHSICTNEKSKICLGGETSYPLDMNPLSILMQNRSDIYFVISMGHRNFCFLGWGDI